MTSDAPSAVTPEIEALVGRQWTFAAYEEVGRASIRKFALAIGDANPLYCDQDRASRSKYGGIIAPPTFVCETMQYLVGEIDEVGGPARRPRLPFGIEIRGGNEYTFIKLLRPDDVLTVRWTVSDVRERDGKTGKLVIATSEISYFDQRGEAIAVNRETSIFRPRDARPEGDRWSEPAPQVAVSQETPIPTGSPYAHPRFDGLREGDSIPPLTKDITLPQMVFYGAATWDFVRYHYDHDYAREHGFPAPFVDGQMLGAFLAQMLSDWVGDPGAILKLGFRFREFAFPGDVLTCRGRISGKSVQNGRHLVECELWIENQRGALVVAPGSATVELPS